jgi:osmotically-inducible protein OsmY
MRGKWGWLVGVICLGAVALRGFSGAQEPEGAASKTRRADADAGAAPSANTPAPVGDRATGVAAEERPSQVDGGAAAEEPSDEQIAAGIRQSFLRDPTSRGSGLQVESERKGIVTLRGIVASEAARARAIEIARTRSGVKVVIDQLEVVPNHDPAPAGEVR